MYETPLVVKTRFFKLEYWAEVIFNRPVVLSRVAPVAVWYLVKASLARRMRVVPRRSMRSCRVSEQKVLTSVDDTSGAGQDGGGSVGDGLVDTPVVASRGSSGQGSVCEVSVESLFERGRLAYS